MKASMSCSDFSTTPASTSLCCASLTMMSSWLTTSVGFQPDACSFSVPGSMLTTVVLPVELTWCFFAGSHTKMRWWICGREGGGVRAAYRVRHWHRHSVRKVLRIMLSTVAQQTARKASKHWPEYGAGAATHARCNGPYGGRLDCETHYVWRHGT
jgi:hypothetical protein